MKKITQEFIDALYKKMLNNSVNRNVFSFSNNDLSGISFDNMELPYLSLNYSNVEYASFKNCKITILIISQSSLLGAVFDNTIINSAVLSYAVLIGTNLTELRIKSFTFDPSYNNYYNTILHKDPEINKTLCKMWYDDMGIQVKSPPIKF